LGIVVPMGCPTLATCEIRLVPRPNVQAAKFSTGR
jgi:hypothetical protein